MAGLNDTHPEAEQVLRAAYRKMSFPAKLRQMDVLYRTGRSTDFPCKRRVCTTVNRRSTKRQPCSL